MRGCVPPPPPNGTQGPDPWGGGGQRIFHFNPRFPYDLYILQYILYIITHKKRRDDPSPHTVKRVDEVVPHRHLVTQDQTTQVSNKFFHTHVENFTINLVLFRHFSLTVLFANVELVRQSRKVSKAACGGAGANLRPSGLQSAILPLRHAFICIRK
jgi:hypothetical protein